MEFSIDLGNGRTLTLLANESDTDAMYELLLLRNQINSSDKEKLSKLNHVVDKIEELSRLNNEPFSDTFIVRANIYAKVIDKDVFTDPVVEKYFPLPDPLEYGSNIFIFDPQILNLDYRQIDAAINHEFSHVKNNHYLISGVIEKSTELFGEVGAEIYKIENGDAGIGKEDLKKDLLISFEEFNGVMSRVEGTSEALKFYLDSKGIDVTNLNQVEEAMKDPDFSCCIIDNLDALTNAKNLVVNLGLSKLPENIKLPEYSEHFLNSKTQIYKDLQRNFFEPLRRSVSVINEIDADRGMIDFEAGLSFVTEREGQFRDDDHPSFDLRVLNLEILAATSDGSGKGNIVSPEEYSKIFLDENGDLKEEYKDTVEMEEVDSNTTKITYTGAKNTMSWDVSISK